MNKSVFILIKEKSEVLQFAAQELQRYLRLADIRAEIASENETAFLRSFFHLIRFYVSPKLFAAGDSRYDDGYVIEIENLEGRIEGTNERSVLLGVYRYLREVGFAFCRPDQAGERAPKYIDTHNVSLCTQADNRYRGMCIEGAVSFSNVLSFVEWLPKMGFNTYFTQFLIPYEFFKTWYAHTNNEMHEKEPVPTPEEVDQFVKTILVPELKKRGLLWQAAGHGWTTAAAGLPGLGWDVLEESGVREEKRALLAQIDGKRGLFHGVPLNTNLCYSNQQVTESLVDSVLQYMEANKRVDVLHFWLADEGNNSCECSVCKSKQPADWYVELLNQVEDRLWKNGYRVKIVFLAYYDLLWPPVEAKLIHPERFLFLFAPITRSYVKPLPVGSVNSKPLPAYERNCCRFPEDVEQNLSFYRGWMHLFPVDSVLYDYHYMWNHFRDFGDYSQANVLWEDVKNLRANGMNGYISCQQTRVFSPTGFGMYVLGMTLWDTSLSFDVLARAYFNTVFGEEGEFVRTYCETLSRLSYEEQPENDGPFSDEAAVAKLKEAIAFIGRNTDTIRRHYEGSKDVGGDSKAWDYLRHASDTASLYLTVLLFRRRGEEEKARQAYEALKAYIRENEEQRQEGFDVYWFIKDRDKVFH